MSDFCGAWTGVSEDNATGEIRAGRLYCRSWSCEHCSETRRRQLQALAASGSPTTLITVTMPFRSHDTADEAAQALVHAWRMTLQAGQREKRFDRIQYLAVFEETKKGWPHLHILARAPWIDQRWLSRTMEHYGAGAIVDIRRVYSARHAARYVAKYVSKAPQRYQGCKRYWRTMSYELDRREPRRIDPTERTGWLSQSDIYNLAWVLERNEYAIEWHSEDRLTATPTRWRLYDPKPTPAAQPPPRRKRVKPI